LESIS
jgi:hypothetical protein